MNTKKKTIEEIIGHKEYCGVFISSYCDCGTAQAITEIQALCKEAIPKEKKSTSVNDLQVEMLSQTYDKAYNRAVNDITTALIERGLLKGEEE